MYDTYHLTLYVDRLVGGIPKHPALIKRWQEAHLKGTEPITAEQATEQTLNLLGSQAMDPDEVVSGIWTGFVTLRESDQLALEGRNVKAMLKESANIVRTLPEAQVRGKPIPLRAKLAERVFVTPNRIPILDEHGNVITEPKSAERPVHVMTMQGPRTALKRADFVEDAVLNCDLKVLQDGVITEKTLRLILDHACLNGIGTDRSQGNGTFTYELTSD